MFLNETKRAKPKVHSAWRGPSDTRWVILRHVIKTMFSQLYIPFAYSVNVENKGWDDSFSAVWMDGSKTLT